jgi:hypothetical protein
VDAFGPRSTYILAGIATATAGLLILLAIIAVPTKDWGQDDQGSQHRAGKGE